MSRRWKVFRMLRTNLYITAVVAAGCGDGSPLATSSALVWSDFYSRSPVDESSSIAEDVAACDGLFFAVGETGWNLLLRAYTGEDGSLLWQDLRPLEGSGVARRIACDDGRVYVAGESYSPAHVAFLRTYDAASGLVLWELEVNEGEWNRALQVRADDGDVFLLTGSGDEVAATNLRSIDGKSGNVRWQANSVSADADSFYTTLAVTEYQVCTLRVPGSPPALQCYDRQIGDRVWYATDIGEPGTADSPRPKLGSGLSAFGRGDSAGGIVAAYDPRDGRLLWSRHDFDEVSDVRVAGDRVLVTGTNFESSDMDHNEMLIFRVNSIDGDGQTVWEHRYERESVRNSVLVDGRLLVAGEEWQVRIYDPQNGVLLAEQPVEELPRSRWMSRLAADGDNYAMVGATFGDTSHRRLDFAVRGYELAR